jgi:hypothetical protein
LEAEAV